MIYAKPRHGIRVRVTIARWVVLGYSVGGGSDAGHWLFWPDNDVPAYIPTTLKWPQFL